MKTIFIPIEINELENLIEKCLEKVIAKQKNPEHSIKPNSLSNLGDIDWFKEQVHKQKSTVYSDNSRRKIPAVLIHKPEGAKNVLFYKDKVLQWIEFGCPKNFVYDENKGVNND